MTLIPDNPVTLQDMMEWYALKDQLTAIKSKEALLRQKIFKGKFIEPREGVNSLDLEDGFVLKGTRVINRKVDDASFRTLNEEFAKAGIPTDRIVKYEPSLVTGEYRKLTAEQILLFDTCLIISDGMPSLDIVKPKRKKE